jgi:hypothetical protein
VECAKHAGMQATSHPASADLLLLLLLLLLPGAWYPIPTQALTNNWRPVHTVLLLTCSQTRRTG